MVPLQMPLERIDRPVSQKRHKSPIAHRTADLCRIRSCLAEERFEPRQ